MARRSGGHAACPGRRRRALFDGPCASRHCWPSDFCAVLGVFGVEGVAWGWCMPMWKAKRPRRKRAFPRFRFWFRRRACRVAVARPRLDARCVYRLETLRAWSSSAWGFVGLQSQAARCIRISTQVLNKGKKIKQAHNLPTIISISTAHPTNPRHLPSQKTHRTHSTTPPSY